MASPTEDTTAVFDGLGMTEHLLRYTVLERIAAAVRAACKPTPAKRRAAGGFLAIHADMVNGRPAVIATREDRVAVLEFRGDRIATVVSMADTDRLGRLAREWRRGDHDDPLIESW